MFVNPRAGRWQRKQVTALTTAFKDAGADVIVTPSLHGPLTIADGVDHVCGVGGDGTIRYVAAAVSRAHPQPSLSVYPLGTVNLLARECAYVTGPAAFVRRALTLLAPRRHHIALINETPMLTCASVGPDSWTVDRVSPRLKILIGRWAYLVAFCAVLARWPRRRLIVAADDRALCCEAVYIAKGRYFAGPWSFAPSAALDAAVLHVVALPSCSRRAFVRFAWSIFRGRQAGGLIRFTCTSLTVSSNDAVPVQADGDVIARLPVQIMIGATPLIFA